MFDVKKILEKLTDVYIFIMILLFPLFVDNTGYYHILECKWYAYVTINLIYFSLCILLLLYFWIFKRKDALKISFSKIQLFSLLFLGTLFLSFIFSPFRKDYDLFIGVGRGEGLIISSLYILSFFFVSLFGKFKKKYLLYFLISSVLVNSIILLQFLGFNPFHMYQNGLGIYNTSFVGTIGNIDFVSALLCIFLSISFASFVFSKKMPRWQEILHLISLFMIFMVIGIIDVLNIKVSSFCTLILLFPFILSNSHYLSRFVLVMGIFFGAYCFNLFLNPQYQYGDFGIHLHFTFNYMVLLLLVITFLFIYLSFRLSKLDYDYLKKKDFIKKCYISIVVVGFFLLFILYCFQLPIGVFSEIHELLHGNFDDRFGTYRIFLWKRTFHIIPQYPILGSGPDSFALRFMPRYVDQIELIGPLALNDTAANVYLTMIVNYGFVGLLSYFIFLISQIKLGIQKMNSYSMIFFVAFLCYLIQDCFNLTVVIVTPVFWLLMAIHYLSLNINID